MTATTSYQAGDILLADFPFVGGHQSQIRPALVVLDTGDMDVLLARITTQRHPTPYDVVLTDWRGARLLAPSIVRMHKMITLSKKQIIKPIGTLQPVDHQRVSTVLNQLFGNW
jgi:mRNA interferase MazF